MKSEVQYKFLGIHRLKMNSSDDRFPKSFRDQNPNEKQLIEHMLEDESIIDFPVFIDSPMQKFDKEHAENIIRYFYPNVSDQVVLFPLIHKELMQDEYKVLKERVSRSFLINNLNNDSSTFLEVEPDSLIQKYDELYLASN